MDLSKGMWQQLPSTSTHTDVITAQQLMDMMQKYGITFETQDEAFTKAEVEVKDTPENITEKQELFESMVLDIAVGFIRNYKENSVVSGDNGASSTGTYLEYCINGSWHWCNTAHASSMRNMHEFTKDFPAIREAIYRYLNRY
jgi:hypothetical protein